jgi:hypothetical protein
MIWGGIKMVAFKKILLIALMLIICSFALYGCKEKNPEITTVITLRNITDEEYNQISNSSKPEGAKINDLKKLYIDVKITNSKKATDRTITLPDLFIIDRYDRVRTTGGGYSEQNNIGTEDAAEKIANITFDSRGLSERDLRSIYSRSEIYISYKLKNSDLVEKRVSIGDSLKLND